MKVEGRAEVRDGELVLPDHLASSIARIFEGNVRVSIKKWHDDRSNQANRYLWGVVYRHLSEHTGHTPEELHEIMKARHARKTYVWDGKEVEGERSTASMDSAEFTMFVDAVRRDAAELGCVVPDANE